MDQAIKATLEGWAIRNLLIKKGILTRDEVDAEVKELTEWFNEVRQANVDKYHKLVTS